VISDELRKILEEQSQRENETIMKEMAKFGGEPPDADGLHVNEKRITEVQR